jgi:uncharacterized protein involved in response to NO
MRTDTRLEWCLMATVVLIVTAAATHAFLTTAVGESTGFLGTSGEARVLVATAFGKPSGRLIYRADRSREVSDRARSSD